jgi:uncharacterized protein
MGRSEAAKNDFDSALKLDPANEQKLRPVIEAEVASLSGQSPPPPQSPQPAATPGGATSGAQNTAAVAQGGSISSRPTFDCGKAKSSLALLICSGEETARADWDLKTAYWARYFSLDKDDRASFREDQDKWYTSLDQKCQLSAPPFSRQQTSCVIDAYKERAAQYRSKLRGAALAESEMTPEQLSQIQQALIALGFFNGEADGAFGPLTRAAIRKFQEANGFLRSDFSVYGAEVGTVGRANCPYRVIRRVTYATCGRCRASWAKPRTRRCPFARNPSAVTARTTAGSYAACGRYGASWAKPSVHCCPLARNSSASDSTNQRPQRADGPVG